MKHPSDDAAPTPTQRQIGEAWLRAHPEIAQTDPTFTAAAIYRAMRLALTDPQSPELVPLWRHVAA